MAVLGAVLGVVASATENGANVYPVGVETVLPGMTPPQNTTVLYEFSTLYRARSFVDDRGHGSVPGFRLNVFADAVKLAHKARRKSVPSCNTWSTWLNPDTHYRSGPEFTEEYPSCNRFRRE